jgi:uncharacterized membrane protein
MDEKTRGWWLIVVGWGLIAVVIVATGVLIAATGLRPAKMYLGIGIALVLSLLLFRVVRAGRRLSGRPEFGRSQPRTR